MEDLYDGYMDARAGRYPEIIRLTALLAGESEAGHEN